MCLHSAYEAGGVVYVRALDARAVRGTPSNMDSNPEHDDLSFRPNQTSAVDARREDRHMAPTRRSQSPSRPSASPQRKPT
jgi:hypothetical protein